MLTQYLYYIFFSKCTFLMNKIIAIMLNPLDIFSILNHWIIKMIDFKYIKENYIPSYPWFLYVYIIVPIIYFIYSVKKLNNFGNKTSRKNVNNIIKDFTMIQNACLIWFNYYIIFDVIVDPLHTLSTSRKYLIYNIYPILMTLDLSFMYGLSLTYNYIRISKYRILYTILSLYLINLIDTNTNNLIDLLLLIFFTSDYIYRICKVFRLYNLLITLRTYIYPCLLLWIMNTYKPSSEYANIVFYVLSIVFLNMTEILNSNKKNNRVC